MQVFAYRATERGIRERNVQRFFEQPPEVPPPRPIAVMIYDIANQRELRRVAEIENQRFDGIQQFRRRGTPDWALSIITEVADRHAICPIDIGSRKRHRPIIEARREAAYRVKAKQPDLSTILLGKWFGKDHTSIAHLIASYQEAYNAPKLVGYSLQLERDRNRKASAQSRVNALRIKQNLLICK
jgi:hypothetical protein